MDIMGGKEKEHKTLYLERRVVMLLEWAAKHQRKRMSTIVNDILYPALLKDLQRNK